MADSQTKMIEDLQLQVLTLRDLLTHMLADQAASKSQPNAFLQTISRQIDMRLDHLMTDNRAALIVDQRLRKQKDFIIDGAKTLAGLE